MEATDHRETVRGASAPGARGRRWAKRILIALAITSAALLMAALLLNAYLTSYVESEKFREAIGRATAKGLKLGTGEYRPIKRTGPLAVFTPGFQGAKGDRTMKELKAENVTGEFNPAGIFLDRWQLERLEIERGSVELQKTESKPDVDEEKPWSPARLVMPDRIYLKEVWCPEADILWMLRKKRAGIYDIGLLITPHGRDFQYSGHNGVLRMPLVPELWLKQADVLITKEKLTVYGASFTPPDPEAKGTITLKGEAGLEEDQTIYAEAGIRRMPAPPWLPRLLRPYIAGGEVSADVDWKSVGTKLETTQAKGWFEITGTRLQDLPQFRQLEVITGVEVPNSMSLDVLKGKFSSNGLNFEMRDLIVEAKGYFRIEGRFRSHNKVLEGKVRFGTTERHLDWLPEAKETVFTRREDGYLAADVELSGTVEHPKEDLTPRLKEALSDAPGALLGVFFRQLGAWFDDEDE